MSATCSGCGDCCAVVTLGANMVELVNRRIDEGDMSPDTLWYRDDLRLLSEEDALTRRPSLTLPDREGTGFYECRHFDYVTRRCRIHDQGKPPVCIGFPWYGGTRRASALEDLPRCSYWADVPFFEADEHGLAIVSAEAVPA